MADSAAAAAATAIGGATEDIVKEKVQEILAIKKMLQAMTTEEDNEEKKRLNDLKKKMQAELIFHMKEKGVTKGVIEIPGKGAQVVSLKSESRPKAITDDIASSAAAVAITRDAFTRIKDSIITGVNGTLHTNKTKKVMATNVTLFQLILASLDTFIRELVENRTEKIDISETGKKRSRDDNKATSGSLSTSEFSADMIQKLKEFDSIQQNLASYRVKDANETLLKGKLKELEDSVINDLIESNSNNNNSSSNSSNSSSSGGSVYNYCQLVDGEIKHYHTAVKEETHSKKVTVTTMAPIIKNAVTSIFSELAISIDVEYDDVLPDTIMHSLQLQIGRAHV